MITDKGKFKAINFNHQIQCPNLKFKGTTNYANCTNHLAISIRVIRSSNHQVQCPNLKFKRDYELRELHESLSNKHSCHSCHS